MEDLLTQLFFIKAKADAAFQTAINKLIEDSEDFDRDDFVDDLKIVLTNATIEIDNMIEE